MTSTPERSFLGYNAAVRDDCDGGDPSPRERTRITMNNWIIHIVLFVLSLVSATGADTVASLGSAVQGRGGAVFTVPPQSRTVWADIEWVVGGETNTAWRHLHLFGDGKARRYFFDGATAVRWGANYPEKSIADKWNGDITSFRVLNNKTKEEIAIRALEIVAGNPGLPPELILSHAKAPMKLDRARRPVDIEVGVFNVGTLVARDVEVRVDGLPDGVRVVNGARTPPCPFGASPLKEGGNHAEESGPSPLKEGRNNAEESGPSPLKEGGNHAEESGASPLKEGRNNAEESGPSPLKEGVASSVLPPSLRGVAQSAGGCISVGTIPALGGGDSILHRVTVIADEPCAFTARIAFSGGNAPEAIAEVPVEIGPSLELPQSLPYIPEPHPIRTEPCEVGAFYFPDWARAHHWLKVWRMAPERRPALGWYFNDNPEVLDWQIKWAVENGISFFLVDWYGKDWHFEKALAESQFAKHIQFANMWCNHIPAPGCDEEHWTNIIRRCLEKDFRHPSYKYVDGMPYFSVWSGDRLERDNGPGGCKRMLDLARQMARDAGYKGIYFQGQCLGFTEPTKRMADFGFDETTTYHYIEVPEGPDGVIPWVREYDDVVAATPAYWRAMREASPAAFLPNITTGYWDYPWNDGPIEVHHRSVEAFRRLCQEARRYAEETGTPRVCLGPLNEWGEGSYAEPNGEFGFGMYEAVRDTFGVKPAEGWPLNYTPADIARGPYPVEDENGGPVKPHNGLRWR